MRRIITICMLTVSTCLFKVIIRFSKYTKERLMIDLAAAQDASDKGEIDDIGWVCTADNIPGPLSKPRHNSILQDFMETEYFNQSVSQLLIRENVIED